MNRSLRGAAAITLGGAAVLAGLGFGTASAAHQTSSMKDKIVVKITTTSGTTWGHVTAHWKENGKMVKGMACKTAKCTYHVPHMTKITLKETPVDNSTWPFAHWSIKGGSKSMSTKKKVTFEATNGDKAVAKAVFSDM
jgi:hypothetical protein